MLVEYVEYLYVRMAVTVCLQMYNYWKIINIMHCYILGPMHQVPVTTIETILPLLAEWTSHIYKHRDDSFIDTLTEKVIIHVFVSVPFTC